MRKCSCPRRQHRRGAEELDFGVERVVERLHEEPARRILLERLLALRDRVVDDLEIALDHVDRRRIELERRCATIARRRLISVSYVCSALGRFGRRAWPSVRRRGRSAAVLASRESADGCRRVATVRGRRIGGSGRGCDGGVVATTIERLVI